MVAPSPHDRARPSRRPSIPPSTRPGIPPRPLGGAFGRRALALGRLGSIATVLSGCFDDPLPPAATETTRPEPGTSSDPDATGTPPQPTSTSSTTAELDTTLGHAETTVTSDATTSDAATTGLDESTTAEPPTHLPCPVDALDATLPTTVMASTAQQDDELQGSCGGGSAPELAYTFTAPADGSYVLDTEGSTIDTVLYVLDGVCEGDELRCNDDGIPSSTASLTSLPLLAGQTVTVVVDAFGVLGGPITLSVREGSVECPAQSFDPAPLPQTRQDQTLLATDQFESSCGTQDEADQAVTFTAPEAGIYRFDTVGSDFDTTLYLLDGTCGGPELACNDDEPGTFDGHSALAVPLAAGQAVTAVVEGWFGDAGTFELTVDRLSGACPDELLGALPIPFMLMGSTAATDEASAGPCGGLGSPDHAFAWTAPADGVYRFDTAGSMFDTVVYLLDGGCAGPPLACNDDAGGPTAAVSAYLLAGQDVIIVVDGASGASGSFALLVEEGTDSGDCCLPHPDPGCEDLPLQVCVCTRDAFCCNTAWDDVCVDLALSSCGAICP